ncbi:hypothetical protein EJ07DRAFT_159253 [Lizonia empirigonia]|nr:hypothetical protein EJ07DRAFT_159253 [Lizonia empirigonia]
MLDRHRCKFGAIPTCVVSLCRPNSSIQFCSSISSVFNHPETTVPEEIIFDLTAPRAMGHGHSRYIAERLLDQACKTLRITASVTRIGQVAGAARTATRWNRREWLPSLVISSASMGILPTTLMGADTVDWIPIDNLAEVLVELALAPRHAGNDVLGAAVNHVLHPRPVKWTSILPVVKETIIDTYPSK